MSDRHEQREQALTERLERLRRSTERGYGSAAWVGRVAAAAPRARRSGLPRASRPLALAFALAVCSVGWALVVRAEVERARAAADVELALTGPGGGRPW